MLPGNHRLQFFDFAVLFEKLIQQHGIHRVITHGVWLAAGVTNYEMWIYFGNFFGDQALALRSLGIRLVMEAHWFKRQNHFTRLIH